MASEYGFTPKDVAEMTMMQVTAYLSSNESEDAANPKLLEARGKLAIAQMKRREKMEKDAAAKRLARRKGK